MKLNWHKATEKPPKSGAYYVICKLKDKKYIKEKDYIMVDADYYYRSYNNWERFGESEGWDVLYWAEIDKPNVPEELSDKINCWFGEDSK